MPRIHSTLREMIVFALLFISLFRATSSYSVGSHLFIRQQGMNGLQQLRAQRLPRYVKGLFLTEETIVAGNGNQKSLVATSLKEILQQPSTSSTGNDIVIIAGFEAFNIQLYKKAAAKITWVCAEPATISKTQYASHLIISVMMVMSPNDFLCGFNTIHTNIFNLQ